MRYKIAIFLTLLVLVFGAITVQGQGSTAVSLNESTPFPENM